MQNKKGMTLVEIIIAIALISLVMVFVFNLLVDIRQEETVSSYSSQDQLNKSIILKTVQADFIDYVLVKVDISNKSANNADIKFTFREKDGSGNSIVRNMKIFNKTNGNKTNGYVTYGDETWKLESTYYMCSNITTTNSTSGNYNIITLNVPAKKTLIDQIDFDLEFLYMGKNHN